MRNNSIENQKKKRFFLTKSNNKHTLQLLKREKASRYLLLWFQPLHALTLRKLCHRKRDRNSISRSFCLKEHFQNSILSIDLYLLFAMTLKENKWYVTVIPVMPFHIYQWKMWPIIFAENSDSWMIICFFQVNKPIDFFLLLLKYLLVIIIFQCKNKSKQNVL